MTAASVTTLRCRRGCSHVNLIPCPVDVTGNVAADCRQTGKILGAVFRHQSTEPARGASESDGRSAQPDRREPCGGSGMWLLLAQIGDAVEGRLSQAQDEGNLMNEEGLTTRWVDICEL